jgi:Flp pilus assembly protein TadD
MLIRSKRHWATLLAVGLPLVVGGCAGGMGTSHGGPSAPEANANAPRMDALAMADRLKAEGNFSAAASMYQQAAQANPSDARPLLGLGESFLAMGSNAEAAQAFSGALAAQPNNLDALRGLGHARILLGQPQFAVTQYQTALKLAPNDTRSLNGLGVAQDMMGDHAAAQQAYHQVLTLDPANQSAKNNLALSMALAGDDAGGIKILEDVSKSSTATATNRQNLALLYGVSGQMAQAEQASRGDLPPEMVSRNMAAMSNNGDAAKKQELLKESLGVELKGRQYAPAAKPITPLTNLAQSSSLEEQPLYMSTQEGQALPEITTGKSETTQTAQSASVVVKTTGKKDGWSDWDEELVDATDVNGGTGTPTASKPAQSTTSNITDTTAVVDGTGAPVQASPDAGKPRFLSSANAIGDDKPATAATTTASTPAASAPAASPPAASSGPAASSSATATQMAAVPPTTTTPAAEKPVASASATAAATPTTAAEKPAAATTTTPAATSTAATAGTATTASTTAAPSSAGKDAASSMTVTAKTVDVAKVYTVQIASYRSEQEASAGWQALATAQAELLAKLPHAVAKADLGAEKGVFYRLQAGSFSDRKEAKALCSDLKDHSIDCMVVEATPATAAPGSSQQSMLDPDNSFVIGAR